MTFFNIFTFIVTGFSIIVHAVLIFLILRKDPKSQLHRALAFYLVFMLLLQVVSGMIILAPTPELALFGYRSAAFFMIVPILFYIFVKKLLESKISKWLNWFAVIFYASVNILNIPIPGIIIKDVVWSETAQFYLFVLNLPASIPFILVFFFFFMSAIFDLFKAYRRLKSAIERNRLKYLFLGILMIPIGFIAILLPPFKHYPIDMIGMSLSGVIFAYTILRYKLLDIVIIIRKGLLYSILTVAVTGAYVSFSLLLRFFFRRPEIVISVPVVIFTALFVALVFQPLQAGTQRFIDRVFFRRRYNPQELTADLSQMFSKTLDLDVLAENLINTLCETLQIGKAALFLVNEEKNQLEVQKIRSVSSKIKDVTIKLDSSLAGFFSLSDTVQPEYVLQKQNIPLEGLDAFDLEIFIPLRIREELKGMLVLGPKLSEELYSLEELNLLEIIARSVALAFDNAFLFTQLRKEKAEIEKARTFLEIKVQERTKELKELNLSLEEKVKERTKELKDKVEMLEKFHKATVERELKMIELKKEIEKLKE